MAWQLTYRPRTIGELHLTSVREALQTMMEQGKFPQVLLFAGPKGTGKTSAARIIGSMLNDPANSELVDHVFFGKKAPKQKQFQEPDPTSDFSKRVYAGNSFVVQEMDAASYRGIDDVRALKDRVMLPPQEGKISVYILDEAHMLTTEAFNALLKLLEEPPAHAVFILATTELHKIPDTIASRSTKIEFHKASAEELMSALASVAKAEKLQWDDKALAQIASRADGSFRDGVKLLELTAGEGKLTEETVGKILGQEIDSAVVELIQAVVAKDELAVTRIIGELRAASTQESYFYKTLLASLHTSLMQDLGVAEGEPIVPGKVARFLLQELLRADLNKTSPVPFLGIEVSLLNLIDRAKQQNGGTNSKKKIEKPTKITVETPEIKPLEAVSVPTPVVPEIDTVAEEEDVMTPAQLDQDLQELGKHLLEQWEQFLGLVQKRNATLAALLRSGKPALAADGIPQVGVYYKFHQEQLQQQKYMTLMQDCAKDVVGSVLPLHISLQRAPQEATLIEVDETKENLAELAEETLL